ncbi:MAG: hypothetical protein JNK82_23495 [Myxococcaceae bacterium]|nr:hypothetical protein [Myxococcaceae bacterium]
MTLGALVLAGCGAELKLGESVGLSPITGETKVALTANRACDTADCKVTFNRAVVMATRQELAGLDGAVKAIELELKELSFTDSDKGERIEGQRMPAGTVTIGEELVIGVEHLSKLPITLRLEGRALDEVKAQIAAGENATLMIRAEITIAAPMPRNMIVRYDVQPTLVIGAR